MPKYNNSTFRKIIRDKLIAKHGKKCMICHADSSKSGKKFASMDAHTLAKYLVMDEIDGNKKNLKITNLRLLCKKCNLGQNANHLLTAIKNGNTSLDKKYIYRNKIKLAETYRYDSFSMYKHVKGYRPFFRWLDEKLRSGVFMTPEYIYANGASMKVGGVLETTIKKWLRPELSDEGQYTIMNILGIDYVVLKSDLPKLEKQHEHENNLKEK
jgi:hypothetical protein